MKSLRKKTHPPMEKIRVKSTIVEIDGDEMARVLWKLVKDKLLLPHLSMDTAYFDLHIKNRDATDDRVTTDAAQAVMKYGVGVKCATITANDERVNEYGLKKAWKSPNATIREMLDGTVFRRPIPVKNIRPSVSTWKNPITIGRHAYGDVYSNTEMNIAGPGRAELVFTPQDGGLPVRQTIKEFTGPGIIQGMHNTDLSIQSFARACFMYALDQKLDLWFSSKDTISQVYDGRHRDIFEKEFRKNWKDKFAQAGISYFYTLIDDAAARIMKSKGGLLWALKNYDGDVMSDMIASANGSLAMMTSVLVSPRGHFEYEAAHGTVQKHYYKHLRGEETSTNPMAIIFAWSGCLKKRAEIDATPAVALFADKLEAAALSTVTSGVMTGDLLSVANKGPKNRKVNTETFIDAIAKNLRRKLSR
ncbi:MAG TPA: NADP-dependent isocitrate dehydrogenase [Syntrophales bacterium]|nr:NADP-dependent isocitrate dehydrogenase [Syntrophales bacterium]